MNTNYNQSFGLRKFQSFYDLAKKQNLKIEKMSSKDLKEFQDFMRKSAEIARKAEFKARESASKIVLNA